MGKVANTPKVDSLYAYSKDEWVDFLMACSATGLLFYTQWNSKIGMWASVKAPAVGLKKSANIMNMG